MSDNKTDSPAKLKFGRTNVALLGAAILSLAAGYLMLWNGDTTLAPVLLVVGYCVLFPLGLAL